jgi:CheY-like chemotaxis protein
LENEMIAPNVPGRAALSSAEVGGVLVVDDDERVRSRLGSALRRHGCTVYLAANGREAVDIYERHLKGIGLVLLDVQMPHLDGPQTLAALRRLNPRVFCCFLSSRSDRRTAEELLRLGAARVLHKPVGEAELERVCRLKAGADDGPQRGPGPGCDGSGEPSHDRASGGLREWLDAFDRAAAGALARESPGELNPEDYRLRAETCPEHGASCARVTFGALRDHFAWKTTDPRALAHTLLQMMLPCGP